MPLETSLWLLPRLPRAGLYVIPRCGHWTQIEHRETFHDLVRRHLAG
ncbi:2-hydroxymuconate semialdehyde hydrolase [bacterium HR39]|nr:2-hydroxymuconate semialdehyde hydrolase [bacterium HR39]